MSLLCSDACLPACRYLGKGAQVGCCRQNKDLQNLTKVRCDGATRSLDSKRGEHFHSCSQGTEAAPGATVPLLEYMHITR